MDGIRVGKIQHSTLKQDVITFINTFWCPLRPRPPHHPLGLFQTWRCSGMGHRTSRQNHYPEGSEEQKEEIIPPILTDYH